MKAIFTVFVMLTCAVFVNAQANFSFDPSKSLEKEYDANEYGSNTITIVNETDKSLVLAWEKIAETCPDEWDISLCDLGSCFPIIPEGHTMNPTGAGEDAYFIFHAWFGGFEGTGSLQLYVYEVGDYENGDTVTFTYTATLETGTKENTLTAEEVKVFPNPASDFVNVILEDNITIQKVQVMDWLGRTLYESNGNFTDQFTIPANDLSTGNYILRLVSKEEETFNGKLFIQK